MNPSTFRYFIYTPGLIKNNATFSRYRVHLPHRCATPSSPTACRSARFSSPRTSMSPHRKTQVRIILPDGVGPGASEKHRQALRQPHRPATVEVTPVSGSSVVTGITFFSGNDDAAFTDARRRTSRSWAPTTAWTTPRSSPPRSSRRSTTTRTRSSSSRTPPPTSSTASSSTSPTLPLTCSAGTSSSSASPARSPPANDQCANAAAVLAGTEYSGTTYLATGTDISPCGTNDAADVWYRYNATSTGPVEISTAGAPRIQP